ncbi:MAG TPA: hypothetical protein VIN38_08055 [Thiobacillus sp.]
MTGHATEVAKGERFEFGVNWARFFHDVVDWIGGYPFEVAKPEEIFDFYRAKGFVLVKLITCAGGLGCNEYVFSVPAKEQ